MRIDHVGLRATRLQIESLMHEVVTLEQRCAQTQEELELSHAQSDELQHEAETQVRKLTAEIAECKEIVRLLENDRRRSILGRQASEIIKTKMASLSIEQVVALIKLTSMVRGFLGRSRVRRIKTSNLAIEVGVLFAMANTVQGMCTQSVSSRIFDAQSYVCVCAVFFPGETGWYMGPNRAIFYFVLKNVSHVVGKW